VQRGQNENEVKKERKKERMNELEHIKFYWHRYKGKGKAIPIQAWTGSEGSRRLRLPDFKTIGT
jgi:hypothetical protein